MAISGKVGPLAGKIIVFEGFTLLEHCIGPWLLILFVGVSGLSWTFVGFINLRNDNGASGNL